MTATAKPTRAAVAKRKARFIFRSSYSQSRCLRCFVVVAKVWALLIRRDLPANFGQGPANGLGELLLDVGRAFFNMELLAKLSYQERACKGDTAGGNQRIAGSAGKTKVQVTSAPSPIGPFPPVR
jgi:hypothetical protein